MLHSIAFAPIDDLKCPFVNASREGFKTAMDISVYSLAIVARHAAESMPDGGAIVTLTYFGGERVVPGYNMMGVCKAALDAATKYLAFDLGPKKIRVNAVSAGPVKTLAASAVGDSDKLAGLYEMAAPMDRNITREEVGAAGMFLLSDHASRDHRRDPPRRRRLQRHGLTRPGDREGQEAHPGQGPGGQPRAGRGAPERRRAEATMSRPPAPEPPGAIPIPVGIGLIRRGDAFLIRRRPAGTVYAGYWEFPGGKCEPGETPAEATARECLEEIGLRVVVGPLRRTVTYRYPHGLVELSFHDCTTEDPDAEPDPDSGFRWVPVDQLATLRFPEANEVILEELAAEWRDRNRAD